jgi:hypothetical protein
MSRVEIHVMYICTYRQKNENRYLVTIFDYHIVVVFTNQANIINLRKNIYCSVNLLSIVVEWLIDSSNDAG